MEIIANENFETKCPLLVYHWTIPFEYSIHINF